MIISSERIVSKIYIFRNKKVMPDKDLAKLYGVQARALNQAVKRNIERFPARKITVCDLKPKKEIGFK